MGQSGWLCVEELFVLRERRLFFFAAGLKKRRSQVKKDHRLQYKRDVRSHGWSLRGENEDLVVERVFCHFRIGGTAGVWIEEIVGETSSCYNGVASSALSTLNLLSFLAISKSSFFSPVRVRIRVVPLRF